jgi:hypothetical protein
MGKKDKKWNKSNWQGRRKDQVETTYKIIDYTIIIGFVVVVSYIIYNFITG